MVHASTPSRLAPLILTMLVAGVSAGRAFGEGEADDRPPLVLYTLKGGGTAEAYDEAIAAASLQGVLNRDAPTLYVLPDARPPARLWLDILSRDGHWLEGREQQPAADLDALVALAGPRLKGAVIWDPEVPATVNVATTIAGVADAVVLSPEFADRFLPRWKLPVVRDLRGMFTGAETGSRKNDAYRWAIREYLQKGLCSSRLVCLYADSWKAREVGDATWAYPRDLAVGRRAFVFDVSPWGDEVPMDDPGQPAGADLETYRMILDEAARQADGQHLTEMSGFFHVMKYSKTPEHESAHGDIATEFHTLSLISPRSVYQTTLAGGCCNQSLHGHAPRKPLAQRRDPKPVELEDKTYICLFMGDFDSVLPVYEFLPKFWADPRRGRLPLTWGINPNLLDTCPDLIAYFYETATPNDLFASDAGGAGYIHPGRMPERSLPLLVEHNRRYFREADMSIAPMVIDLTPPSAAVKDAYLQFAPDGMGLDVQPKDYAPYVPDAFPASEWHVWKGMPVTQLEPGQDADVMAATLAKDDGKRPAFHLFRIVWETPEHVERSVAALREKRPDANVEVVDAATFFALFRRWKAQGR